jgi:hypothetical protein
MLNRPFVWQTGHADFAEGVLAAAIGIAHSAPVDASTPTSAVART